MSPSGHRTGWGVSASTAIKLGIATPRLGVVYGRGIATYMNDGGTDLAPSVSTIIAPGTIILVPEAEAVKLLGVSAYVDFQWAKQWSSSLGYSFTKVDNTNFQDATAFHKGEYASANLLYAPADNVLAGAEILWGRRTDNDGNEGTDTRLQATFKWSFTSSNIWDCSNDPVLRCNGGAGNGSGDAPIQIFQQDACLAPLAPGNPPSFPRPFFANPSAPAA